MNPLPSDVHPDVPVLFIFLRYKFAKFEHFRICVAILPTSSTPSEVGDCEVRFLHVLAIPEYDLNLLCDGSILIQSSIDIVDWYWVWQGAGFQLMLLGKGLVDKHPCHT